MSSIPFRGPEFRLHLGYPDIILTSGGRTLGRVRTEAPDLRAALARMAEAVRRTRGRLVAVLPDSEVWRGRLDLAGGDRGGRRASARTAIAGRLGTSPDDVAVVIGARDAGGSFPVAGVRRSTLVETRALLAAVSLRPSAIIGAGLFPGFSLAPRLGGGWSWPLPTLPPERRGVGAAIGAGAVVSLAVLVLGAPNPPAPPPAAATAALPTVVLAEAPVLEAARTAEVVLPDPPAPSLALTRSTPPKPRPAPAPVVTLAARNMPTDLPVVIATPKPTPAQRLAELGAVPARVLDAIAAPLHRPAAAKAGPDVAEIARTAMPALAAPATKPELRPLRRPKGATPAPVAAKPAATPAAAETATLAPRPRAVSGSSQPAVLVASLEPAPFAEAVLAAAAAATVAAVRETPPPPRPAAAKPAPVAAKKPPPAPRAAPVVVRPAPLAAKAAAPAPKPVSVQPLVGQAVPQRQLVATAAPARQPVAAPVRPRIVAVPAPVRQKVVVQPAKPALKPVAAKSPAAKPKPVRVAQKPVRQKPAKQQVGVARGDVSLVGVFASADGRHALVRLPNGNIEKVRAGDRVQGVQVAAISADSVRLTGRGRDTVLRLPD